MVAAFGANLVIVLQRLAPDNLAAMAAFQPKTFGADTLPAFLRFDRRFISSEPSHADFQYMR